MIGPALSNAATGGPVLALVQQPPDSPFTDILGWLIVFFVVIWPIIRGLLDSAKTQREKFEKDQRQRPGRRPASAKTERRSRIDEFLEEMISARPDSVEADPMDERPTVTPPPASETPPPIPKRKQRSRSKPKPNPQPQPRSQPTSQSQPADEFSTDFAGDPFDESFLETDLVPDSDLVEVPDEDTLEIAGPYANTLSELDDSAMDDFIGKESNVRTETALERIQRQRSPWQAAFVLKEVLGPPASTRPHEDHLR